jgi:oxaloacetate decarboxylase gamma subunit
MTIIEMLQQSAILTLLGMAVVFVFLWLMIICVNITGRLIHNMNWDMDVRPQEPVTSTAGAQNGGTAAPEIAAAITATVTEYRKN